MSGSKATMASVFDRLQSRDKARRPDFIKPSSSLFTVTNAITSQFANHGSTLCIMEWLPSLLSWRVHQPRSDSDVPLLVI